jgi:Raf kinase inhibitor-like YbhB/YbcL family protein
MKKHLFISSLALLSLTLAFVPTLIAQTGRQPDQQSNSVGQNQFQVSTTTFTNGEELPLIMVLGSNNCTFVSGGGDESPEVSWTNAPRGTRSFVVTLFDTTASFTHWGMYNIPATTTALPQDAGVAGSTYGQQVFNDFYYGAEYDGPCPPNNATPYVHNYVLTVFALDTTLTLTSNPPNFPANAETLYRAMDDHVLRKASVHGYFTTIN